jgi:hypothetical protein
MQAGRRIFAAIRLIYEAVARRAKKTSKKFAIYKKWKSLDYVAGWFMKAAQYSNREMPLCFVSTSPSAKGFKFLFLATRA